MNMKLPRFDIQLGLLLLALSVGSQPLLNATLSAAEDAARQVSQPVQPGSAGALAPAARPDEAPPPSPPEHAAATAAVNSPRGEVADSQQFEALESATENAEPSAETAAAATAPPAPAVAAEPRDVEVGPSGPRELSVPPVTQPLLPADRPAWVGAAPDLSNFHHRLFIGSYPVQSAVDVDAALDEPMLAAVYAYLDEQVFFEKGPAGHVELDAGYIRRNLLQPGVEYVAELATSEGPLYQKWVILEITPEHRLHFQNLYRQAEQRKRLGWLGGAAALLITTVGVANWGFRRRSRRYVQTQAPPQGILPVLQAEPAAANNCCGRSRTGWGVVILIAGAAWLAYAVTNPQSSSGRGAAKTRVSTTSQEAEEKVRSAQHRLRSKLDEVEAKARKAGLDLKIQIDP
jgi:hypothetical protein